MTTLQQNIAEAKIDKAVREAGRSGLSLRDVLSMAQLSYEEWEAERR